MRKSIYLILILLISLPFYSYSKDVCSYKVKEGDWIAKILRDLGSKNPFSDKSYFKTLSLNKGLLDVNKLKKGDLVLIPSSILNEELKSSLCRNEMVLKESSSASLVKEKAQERRPASLVNKVLNKPSLKKPLSNMDKKNRAELSDFEPFPILEYKAKVPSGGAK